MTPTVRQALAQSGLVPVDARALLVHVLDRDRAWLAAHAEDVLNQDQTTAFFSLVRRRHDGEPVAYLTGTREFWGLTLTVTPHVLIPRPETESVVECALARLPRDRAVRILDLGTGSGAIALALAHELHNAVVVGSDRSLAALLVARASAQRLAIANAEFVEADWYAGVPAGAWDLIASNPPYVDGGDAHLAQGDLRYEPRSALSPGADGLAALRVIIGGARERLVAGGFLIVEHGHDQSDAVRELFRAAGFSAIAAARDLAGIPRVVAGRSDQTGPGALLPNA